MLVSMILVRELQISRTSVSSKVEVSDTYAIREATKPLSALSWSLRC